MTDLVISVPDVGIVTAHPVLIVRDAVECTAAEQALRALAAHKRDIVAAFAPAKKAAHGAHAEICALEKRALAPLDAARSSTEAAVLTWRAEEARVRAAAEAEARRIAEAEALAHAVELESLGAPADLVASALADVAPVAVAPVVAAIEGVSVRLRWTAEVRDLPALLRWCADHAPELVEVRAADLARIGQRTDGQREIPGVHWVRVQGLSVRG